MPCQIHAVVQDATDLDGTYIGCTEQQEVSWTPDAIGRWRNVIPTVMEMVGSSGFRQFRSSRTARAFWIGGDVKYCLSQQFLVSRPRDFSEMLVCPS